MTTDIKAQALEMARALFPDVPVDELLVNATKIEAYLNISNTFNNLTEFSKQCLMEHPSKGAIHFSPYDGQKATMQYIQDHKRVLIQSGRQMGTTTMLSYAAIWDALRNPSTTVAFVSNTFTSVQSIRDRITFTCDRLPMGFAKITRNNKQQIEFANGSTISFLTPTPALMRGRTINTMYMDQAGFISHKVMNDFWKEMWPLFATGMRICMASSGKSASEGVFYELWQDDNDFIKVELPWNVHPERDASWAANMAAMIGDDAFKREYECGFKSV